MSVYWQASGRVIGATHFERLAGIPWSDEVEHRVGVRYAEAIRGAREMRRRAVVLSGKWLWFQGSDHDELLDGAWPDERAAGSPSGWITRP